MSGLYCRESFTADHNTSISRDRFGIALNPVPTSSNPSLQHHDHDEFIQVCRCYLCAHWISHPFSFLGSCSRSVHAPLLPRLVLCKRSIQPVGTCLPYIHSRLIFIETFVPVASTIKRGYWRIFIPHRKWTYWAILFLSRQICCFGFDRKFYRSRIDRRSTRIFGMYRLRSSWFLEQQQ